jgi:endo-1,4-beta-xylanase
MSVHLRKALTSRLLIGATRLRRAPVAALGDIVTRAPTRAVARCRTDRIADGVRFAALSCITVWCVFGCGDKGTAGHSATSAGGAAGTGATDVAGAAGNSENWGELRISANRAGKLLGAAVNVDPLRSDLDYAATLAQQFSYVTAENSMKWGPLAPSATVYNFGDADTIVEFAEAQHQAVKGHTLIWHKQLPAWVSDSVTADELRAAMKHHIETTMRRYHGRVRAWDVVNEAIDANTASGFTDSIFYRKLGPGFIEEAFRMAKLADPDALLHYNEVGIERTGTKSDLAYNLMKDLIARGVPIDGIGFQSHITMHRYPAESQVRANIRRFAALGLKVHISELDVKTRRVPGDQLSRWQAQRIPFQQVVGICVEEPGCEGVTLWGVTDRYAWTGDDGVADEPLAFDQQYAPKPAYAGVLAGLNGLLPGYGANVVTEGSFDAGGASWTVGGGSLTIAPAIGRAGMAACVTSRMAASAGLSQDLLAALSPGGQFAFSAWVRVVGASTRAVDFAVTTNQAGAAAEDVSLGSISASDNDWVELAGNFGMSASADAQSIQLKIYGPPAGVDLCVSDVRLQALTAE